MGGLTVAWGGQWGPQGGHGCPSLLFWLILLLILSFITVTAGAISLSPCVSPAYL